MEIETKSKELPLTSIRSAARFVLLGTNGEVLSEHDSTPSAVRALAEFTRNQPSANVVIYRRTVASWIEY